MRTRLASVMQITNMPFQISIGNARAARTVPSAAGRRVNAACGGALVYPGSGDKTFVTKDDFYTAMRDMQKQLSELQKQLAELESRLLRWTFGFWVTAIAAIVAARWMR